MKFADDWRLQASLLLLASAGILTVILGLLTYIAR